MKFRSISELLLGGYGEPLPEDGGCFHACVTKLTPRCFKQGTKPPMLFSAVAAEVIDELFNIHAESVAAKIEDEDEDDAESVAMLPPGDISKSFTSDVVNGWCCLHCTHVFTKALSSSCNL